MESKKMKKNGTGIDNRISLPLFVDLPISVHGPNLYQLLFDQRY